ncbi:hypothetical protein SAMN02982917_3277 [Azospirillum oryzae]|uniref:Uncharacterized protein n=1 Tax=Azospirillum oryzae TaxID=286727 RepID=A0A1X7G4Y5_9PROT|nr:hypothetical protein SAMN02982917_3277 [Azospirillum oryzae]
MLEDCWKARTGGHTARKFPFSRSTPPATLGGGHPPGNPGFGFPGSLDSSLKSREAAGFRPRFAGQAMPGSLDSAWDQWTGSVSQTRPASPSGPYLGHGRMAGSPLRARQSAAGLVPSDNTQLCSRCGSRGLPVGDGLRPKGAQSTAGDQVALKAEGVVDGGVQRDETLGRAWRLEALHLPFASPERLTRDFGPVVLAPAVFMVRRQTDLTKRSLRGAQLVGGVVSPSVV